MPTRRPQVISHTPPLPFTAADAEYIARTGKLKYERPYVRPKNESNFYLDDLTGHPILSWPPELPECDPRGNASAPAFDPWKKATDSTEGIAGNDFSFKAGGRIVPFHSYVEAKIFSCLEMNPFVVEIRPQYPEWDAAKLFKRAAEGKKMLKTSILTIDFMLTLKYPDDPKLYYHAISCKPYDLVAGAAKRHLKEFTYVNMWRCTHEIMTEFTYTEQQSVNCRRLMQYMRYVQDISSHKENAARLALSLARQSHGATTDQRIDQACAQHSWHRDEGYRYFGIAAFLGYVIPNHDFELWPTKPLHLRSRLIASDS
ncbi:hypothetical protein HBH1_02092 [Herbaspirillum sp. BH-1]|uniref:hypothetical protein n=1 Tax=Herbaspirillum sp. (strain BH-1) TaxID=2058884 RepID=UPI000CC13DDA|nr:hypothetical protein [Herbaspirillum sp. BH-1]PLY59582.1 hypothetical protein HBH1_02092 [Herbaspirillum sp. BH-1]